MILNLINGKIWQGGLVKTNLQIKDGKIFKIGKKLPQADQEIDVTGKVVFPGFIDCHVHFRDFDQAYKEDWESGSRAAAHGGITTVLDMPNNQPPMLTINDLKRKYQLAQKKSVVNFAFHFGSNEDNLQEIKKLSEYASHPRGEDYKHLGGGSKVISVKVYMNETTGKLKIENKEVLQKIFNSYPLITAHAEGEKVKEAMELIKKTRNKLYLCHISTKDEIKFLRKNKIKGKIFVEVTPHHLFLTEDFHLRGESPPCREAGSPHLGGGLGIWQMKPSLKSKEDQNALWQAINNGLVDTIATDHAPHTISEKKSDNPPFGVPGVETMMPLLFNAYSKKKISLGKIVELCSANPAKIFNLKNKGKIKVGFDADLSIVDLNLEKKVITSELKTKCGWSPYDGWKLRGWPVMTIINGQVVFDKDQIFASVENREKNNVTQ